jgi:hypothetical protein
LESGPTLFGYVTTPAVVGVIDAVLAGVITFLGTAALGLEDRLAVVLGVVVAVVSNLGLSLYAARVPSGIREPSGHQSKPRGSLRRRCAPSAAIEAVASRSCALTAPGGCQAGCLGAVERNLHLDFPLLKRGDVPEAHTVKRPARQ